MTGVAGLLISGVVLTVVSEATKIVGGAVVGVVVGGGTGALEVVTGGWLVVDGRGFSGGGVDEVVTGGWLVVGGRGFSGGGVEEEYVAIIHI